MSDNNITKSQAVIIGGGPAGVSSSLYLARAGINVCIIENGPRALARAHKIDNYYGLSASGASLYAAGLEQAQNLGVKIIQDEVINAEYTDCFTLSLKSSANKIKAPVLILATGTKNISLKLPKLKYFEGKGISYCALCDGFFFRKKRAAVLGSGAYALHEAEYLRTLADSVTVLTNGENDNAAKAAGFNTKTALIKEINGEDKLTGITFVDGSTLELDGLFIALGTADSTDIARKLGAQLNGSFIKIDSNCTTNLPGLFAAGDCTGGLRQITKTVYEGTRAALSAIEFIKQKNRLI